MLRIDRAASIEVPKRLILEYADATAVDLSFQNFHEEVASLTSWYEAMLVGWWDDEAAGVVALRRIDDHICEMKRLYVRPAFRGLAIGRALAEAAVSAAREKRFTRMRLDTLPSMSEAIGLYRSLGFIDIEPYRYNPVEGTVYMELDLHRPRA